MALKKSVIVIILILHILLVLILVSLTPDFFHIDILVLILSFFICQVEDGEYFQTLPENTIFILLRPGEAWAPAGEDIVSQGH